MTYLSFNFANLVTVTLMLVIGFGILAFAQKAVVKMQSNAAS